MVTHKSLSEVSPVKMSPYAPENKTLSKKEFVEKNNKLKEIAAKAKAFTDEEMKKAGLSKEHAVEEKAPEPQDAPVSAKPKKIKKTA